MKLGRRKTVSIVNGNFDRLFSLAEKEALKHNMYRADRYVELARKIGMRYNVPIPAKYKKRLCKHCYSYLLPGVNARVRTGRSKVIIFCENCKKYMRFPFIREVKERRRKKVVRGKETGVREKHGRHS